MDSSTTPLEIYHGVPAGWSKAEILSKYKKLGGQLNLDGSEATEPGAPSWLPDRYNWLQYRETLYRIADGVQLSDQACIEVAIQYIELNYFGSYSGYIREKLTRRLKHSPLTDQQKQRLKSHFKSLVNSGQCFQEYREYAKLLKRIEPQGGNSTC